MNKDEFISKSEAIPRKAEWEFPNFGTVVLRCLSPSEHLSEYREWLFEGGKDNTANKARWELRQEKFIALCLLDRETLKPMFSSESELTWLKDQPIWPKLVEAVERFNWLTADFDATLKKKLIESSEAQNGSFKSPSVLPLETQTSTA